MRVNGGGVSKWVMRRGGGGGEGARNRVNLWPQHNFYRGRKYWWKLPLPREAVGPLMSAVSVAAEPEGSLRCSGGRRHGHESHFPFVPLSRFLWNCDYKYITKFLCGILITYK